MFHISGSPVLAVHSHSALLITINSLLNKKVFSYQTEAVDKDTVYQIKAKLQ